MSAARSFLRMVLLAAAGVAAGCGEAKKPTGDPYAKPTPTIAFAYEGKSLEEWTARLEDRDPAARRDAAFAVGAFGPVAAESAEALVPLLKDPDPGVRWAALVAVDRTGATSPAVATGAVASLAAAEPGVRRAARAAVARLGDAAADALLAAMAGDDWDRASAAADVLAARGAGAVIVLRRVLADPRSDTAALAARALGSIGPAAAAAIPDLVKCLGRQGTARLSAIDALAAIGPASRPALEAALNDPDERVQSAAQAALDRLPPK